MRPKYIISAIIFTAIFCTKLCAHIDLTKYHDYRKPLQNIELQKMQDFHLEQAKTKLTQKQMNHAWGDFAHLLCHVPNHHQALQHMLTLTLQLHKESEMQEYLTKAIELYPDDGVLHMLYGAYLYNVGKAEEAQAQLQIAQKLEGFRFNQSALKNGPTKLP